MRVLFLLLLFFCWNAVANQNQHCEETYLKLAKEIQIPTSADETLAFKKPQLIYKG